MIQFKKTIPILAIICLLLSMAQFNIAATSPKKSSSLVNLNSASAVELITLPRVGKSTAQRIIAYREKNGPFKRVEDLMKVKGIGEKTFQKLAKLITVNKKSTKRRKG